MSLHHVQVAAPPGSEPLLRPFYAALGFVEVAKPPVLAERGGCWFRRGSGPAELHGDTGSAELHGDTGSAELHGDTGSAELHVGIEVPFTPARKAHPAIDVGDDLDATALRVAAVGAEVRWADPAEWAGSHLAGLRRFHTTDPVGNRVEVVGR